MQTQIEYEAEVHVAVFRSDESLAGLEDELRRRGIDFLRVPLVPGRYQLADRRLGRNLRAAIIGAIIGAVVGAAIGAALVVLVLHGPWWVGVWLAVACAAGGAVIGGLIGVQQSAGYDDDAAPWMSVGPGEHAVALRTHTPSAAPGHGHTREMLRRAGAVAFLDVPMFETTQPFGSVPSAT